MTTGKLFVRYVTVGLLAVLASILFIKLQFGGALYAAIAIFIVNIITVLGYTKAVCANPDLLAEADSADHAYYLGFSLTVGALAISFFGDTLKQELFPSSGDPMALAVQSRDIVHGSLAQFAAGLTATLIGLSAKIYISSLQNIQEKDPEDLIRRLRSELFAFQVAIKKSTILSQ